MTRSAPALFVLRHGRSVANEAGLIASSIEHAGDAYGLTDEGRAQVRATLAHPRERPADPVAIVSSPLLRARETAEIAATYFGSRLTIDARLIERGFGAYELGPDTWYDSVWAIDRRDPSHRTRDVESVTDVWRRLRDLTDELSGCESIRSAGSVLLVTHGDVASTLLCAAAGAHLSRHREIGALATAELRALDWPAAAGPPIFDRDS